MQDRNTDRGNKPEATRFGRFSRSAAFWVLIILIPLLIINVFSPRRNDATELSYTEFMTQLEAGNLQQVTIMPTRQPG